MASTHKHLRSSTANKRPTTAIADGQIALNTNTTSPGLFFKDSTGATIIKVGPVHVGSSAPNASPPAGGSSGNSTGEIWLDTSLTPNGVKIWNGASWTNATPIGSTTVQGLLELATNAETQTGTDPDRAVTPAGLQSKVSDSTSTTSSTTIASSTAVKSAYDLANAALPKTGGTVTGNLEIGTTGSLSFEGATADAFETTIAVTDPTADRTITLPDTTGTVVTTGDTGTVTSTMIADGTIVNGDINASAAIAGTKISPDFGSQTVQTTGIVSHALGTAGAPTVTFTGDTNTGIYSPGADQVAISTSGTGRLFVDASGRVGINSAPSLWLLEVKRDSASSAGGAYPVIQVNNPNANGYAGVYLNDSTAQAGLETQRNTGHLGLQAGGAERLRITSTGTVNIVGAGTAGSTQAISFNGSAPVNSLVIDSSGRLGVGTSSPDRLLHLSSNVYPQLRMVYPAVQTWDTGVESTGFYSITRAGQSAAITVDTSNRVGIGTSSPANLLHLYGSAALQNIEPSATTVPSYIKYTGGGSDRAYLGLERGDGNGGIIGSGAGYAFVAATASTNPLILGTNGAERLRIDSSGRVGIGTTTPGNFVGNVNVVVGSAATSTTTAAVTCYSGTATYGGLYFADGTVGDQLYRGYVEYKHDVDALALGSGGSERARIDSSGRLLVGTSTAPLYGSLQVYKSGENISSFVADSGFVPIFAWNKTTGSGTFIEFGTGTSYTIRGSITYNSGTGQTSYNLVSDYRAKSLLGNVENSGEIIDALKVYRGLMNGATIERPMLVAHETQEVAPYCVTGEKDAVDNEGNPVYQQMDHQVLVPLLIAEIQQLRARVAALENA